MKKATTVLLAILVSAVFAFGQATTGKIVGTVSAPDGAVAGATIVVTDNLTKTDKTVTAKDDGTFEVSQLSFGIYTVKITAKGFKTFTATELKIDAGREYPLNVSLEVGQVTEQVTVTAGAETINSTNGEISTTVSQQQIIELPLNGRNPLSLLNLQAGVNATSGSINGQRTSSVNYTRDGLNVQDNFIRNGFVSDQPTVDDTSEFGVTTANAGAEQGAGSTQVSLVTPRGGTALHGALYEFNRNSKFTANSFFNNTNLLSKPFLNRNQFGGKLSGPVPFPHFGEGGPAFVKNRVFFFVNYEGFRLAQQGSITGLQTLLPAARNGDFTYLGTDGVNHTVNVLTGNGLNLVPVANANTFANAGGSLSVDPIIKSRILNALPTAGNGVFTGINLLQTINLNRSDPEIRNQYVARIDGDMNERNSVNFVYKRNNISDARTDVAAGFLPGTTVSQGGPTNLFTGAYRATISSNFSNEFRAGFQYAKPFFANNGIATDYLIGLPLVTQPENTFQNQGRNTLYRNIQDNAVYSIGNHSLRFGFSLDSYVIESLNLGGVTPTYNISSTSNPNTPGLTNVLFGSNINSTDLGRANSLRYLLAGIIGGASVTANLVDLSTGFKAGAPSLRKLNFEIYAGYISDQWRLKPNLTVNLGLRYELYTPLNDPQRLTLEPQITNAANPLADLLNPNGNYVIVGTNSGHPGDFFKMDKNNLGPNVSVAYQPKFEKGFLKSLIPNDTVIRGGFRIGYVNDEYVRSADNASLNNAGIASQTVSALNGASASLKAALTPQGAFGAVPGFINPAVTVIPRPYTLNNTPNATLGSNGTVSLIDPNLQNQKLYEYNIGIQRELAWKTVFEIRYVGNFSNELVRSIDYNQVKVRGAFLTDFLAAQSNCRLQATAPVVQGGNAFVATAGNPNPLFNCSSAAYNPAIPGSQQLSLFTQLGTLGGAAAANTNGGVGTAAGSSPTFLSYLAFDVPADYIAAVLLPVQAANARNLLLANPNTFVANLTTNGGKLRYNSLQTEIRRRFSDGLSLQANYTFQKTLTNVPTAESEQTRVSAYLDNADQGLDYGRAQYDRTHTFNFNAIYELPFGKGKKFLNQGGWVDKLVGGFQMTSIVTLSSGTPLSIIDNSGTLNRGARSTNQSATSSLTSKEIKKLTGIYKTPNGIFFIDPKVLFATGTGNGGARIDLTQPLPAGVQITGIRGAASQDTPSFAGQVFFYNKAGSTGTLPRYFINGPRYINWDAGFSKGLRLTENTRLQLRGEVYNVLNHANFFPNITNMFNVNNTTTFGKMTTNYSPRILQFGARFDF